MRTETAACEGHEDKTAYVLHDYMKYSTGDLRQTVIQYLTGIWLLLPTDQMSHGLFPNVRV